LIRPLTAWVIDTALAQLAEWARAGQHPKISINISVRNLDESDFAATLAGCCQARRGRARRSDRIHRKRTRRYSARALEQVGR